jgi:hypothetical protein
MQSRVKNLKWIACSAVLAVLAVPAPALAGKPETAQMATYLSGIVVPTTPAAESGRAEAKQIAAFLGGLMNRQPDGAASGRAEAAQIAAYLSGVVVPQPTPAESGRAEARAFGFYLRGTTIPAVPTPAESSRAETKAFAGFMSLGLRQVPATSPSPEGFDWGDAGIGAAAMLGVVALIACLGASLVFSRRSHRRQVAST